MPTLTKISATSNWGSSSPKDGLFTSDFVIDAYIKGKSDGIGQKEKLIQEKFSTNLKKLSTNTSELITFLKSKKIPVTDVFLKVNSWSTFNLLVIVPRKDFTSSKVTSVYNYISDLEVKEENDLFRFQISILSAGDKINTGSINADGFRLKYNSKPPKKVEEGTRNS
ncbi:MAG: hypothetical protein IPP32_16465 [Bacteroidetes bacterium]|nr:hypothetical protein [Bacteroidota bacterium]